MQRPSRPRRALAVSLGVAPPRPWPRPRRPTLPTRSVGSVLQRLSGIDPGTAVSVGQSVCPMLSEPGQRMADVAGGVADTLGRPFGPATMFTGFAISVFCPSAVARLADGSSLSDLGGLSGMLGGL